MANSGKKSFGKKLWIGNLDKRLTEYNLLQMIQCYGEIENFEYLFHTTGPNKGEPRTFCFVEYKEKEVAEKALKKLNGKTVFSRTLCVRWAEVSATKNATSKDGKVISPMQSNRNKVLSPVEKIKAIERKLHLMEKQETEAVVFHGKHHMLRQKTKLPAKQVKETRWKPYRVNRKRS